MKTSARARRLGSANKTGKRPAIWFPSAIPFSYLSLDSPDVSPSGKGLSLVQ